MFKMVLTGELIKEDQSTIVMQEGNAVATYSRKHYKLSRELEQPYNLRLTGKEHAIAVPMQ